MRRRLIALLMGMLVLLPAVAACTTRDKPVVMNGIRIYQVLPVARNSPMVNADGQGEAIAVVNAGNAPYTLSGWTVASNSGQVTLPKLTMSPGQVVYLADDAVYFEAYWNFAPDFEYGEDTDKAVPDLKLPAGKAPVLNNQGDVVRLLDETGKLMDIVAYGAVGNPPAPWSGPAVQLVSSFPIMPANQVITRLKENGNFLLDEKATSWSGGTPADPQRVWYPGQSNFPVRSVTGNMTVTAASAPDNAGPMLFDLVDKAKKTIRIVGYQFTSDPLADHLIAAVRRGVRVQLVIERNPGGGDMYYSDKVVQQRMEKAGIDILYNWKWDGDLSTRYNPVHNKYAMIDDDTVLIASGNWINSVYTTDPTCGNREWMVAIQGNPDVAKLFREVWDSDFGTGSRDIRHYDEKLDLPGDPDNYDAGPCFRYVPVEPTPLTVTGRATVTRILSPDNVFDEQSGFLGLLHNAKKELLISANYINKWWGASKDPGSVVSSPNPYLTEIIAAARRGVTVKVIFDRKSVKADNLKDNQYTVQYLNDLAQKEKLPLEARLVNMDGAGIGRTYHNKSLIVDGDVVISSINGSENSFRYAREAALKIDGMPQITDYFRTLFMHDWDASARPNEPWQVMAVPRNTGTFIDWAKNAELDVVGYEVYYRSTASVSWQLLGSVQQPGFEDTHTRGMWGVVAINRAGAKSNYAVVAR